MFKGSRGVRLQYKKSDGSYDYVQPVILPDGVGILIHGNSKDGVLLEPIAEVDLKRASDLDYAYTQFVGVNGYLTLSVAQQRDRILEYTEVFGV